MAHKYQGIAFTSFSADFHFIKDIMKGEFPRVGEALGAKRPSEARTNPSIPHKSIFTVAPKPDDTQDG